MHGQPARQRHECAPRGRADARARRLTPRSALGRLNGQKGQRNEDGRARRLVIFAGAMTALGATAWMLAVAAALDALLR